MPRNFDKILRNGSWKLQNNAIWENIELVANLVCSIVHNDFKFVIDYHTGTQAF